MNSLRSGTHHGAGTLRPIRITEPESHPSSASSADKPHVRWSDLGVVTSAHDDDLQILLWSKTRWLLRLVSEKKKSYHQCDDLGLKSW